MSQDIQEKWIISIASNEIEARRFFETCEPQMFDRPWVGRVPSDRKARLVLRTSEGQLVASVLMFFAEAKELKDMLGLAIPVMQENAWVLVTTQCCCRTPSDLDVLRYYVHDLATNTPIRRRYIDHLVGVFDILQVGDQDLLKDAGYQIFDNPRSGLLITTALRQEHFEEVLDSMRKALESSNYPGMNFKFAGPEPFKVYN